MFQYTKELAEKLAKAIASAEIKAEGEAYSMTISEEIADRSGETVIIAGGEFENYMKNPVVLVDHEYEISEIVGKTTGLSVEGTKLIANWVWAGTEKALVAKELYDGGFLKASSIGFIPMQRQENDRSIITKWELLEWSLVAVPCNPNALSNDGKALYKKGIESGFIKEGETIVEPTEPTVPSELDEIKTELAEIKAILKTLADGKAEEEANSEAIAKARKQKETMQRISHAMSSFLENVKKLDEAKK